MLSKPNFSFYAKRISRIAGPKKIVPKLSALKYPHHIFYSVYQIIVDYDVAVDI